MTATQPSVSVGVIANYSGAFEVTVLKCILAVSLNLMNNGEKKNEWNIKAFTSMLTKKKKHFCRRTHDMI